MERFVIIVAGGKGERMQSDLPKQFMLLADKPIIMHSIEAFSKIFSSIKIILVLPKFWISHWEDLCEKFSFTIPVKVVEGGDTRFDSVKNGLATIDLDTGIVAIHDAVRPLISVDLINRLYENAELNGNAIPAVVVNDSLRMVSDSNNQFIDRTLIRSIQTPQCFLVEEIKKAFEQPYQKSFTDEATVFENAGKRIFLVEGETSNIKVTTPIDIIIAEALLKLKKD